MMKSIQTILIVLLVFLIGCQIKGIHEKENQTEINKKRIKPNGEGWILAVPGIKDRIDRSLYEVILDSDGNKWWRKYIDKYGFKSYVNENCFWCGRHIDLNTSSVVILYNKNDNTDFIPENFSIVSEKDTSIIGKWKLFSTEIICSQKCYKELKDTYFKDLKDSHIICDRGNGKRDYYYFPIKK